MAQTVTTPLLKISQLTVRLTNVGVDSTSAYIFDAYLDAEQKSARAEEQIR